MPQWESGTTDAWITRRLFEAWRSGDADALASALDESYTELPNVMGRLVHLVGSTVYAIGELVGEPYEVALSEVMLWFAQRSDGDPAADVARAAMTAYTGDDTGATAAAMNEARLLNDAPADEIMMHLMAMAQVSGKRWAEATGRPFDYVVEGWWQWLGVDGEQPA